MILLNLNQHMRTPSPSSFVPSAVERVKIRDLLAALAGREDELRGTRFLAPCVRGGAVVLRGGGLLYSFTPQPQDFEGWGIFEPFDETTARLIEEAAPRLIREYLQSLKQIRLRLAYRVEGQTWLASPVNEADARQRLDSGEAQRVFLVQEGAQFEQIVARWDGAACWFEEVDRRADPTDAERLREALRSDTPPAQISWKNCTPEMRGCYVQAMQQRTGSRRKLRYLSDEQRLREALAFGGGHLISLEAQDDYWEILWATPNEYSYTSTIRRRDLTVIDAGFCLSGKDSDFDVQSLVKVAEAGGDCQW